MCIRDRHKEHGVIQSIDEIGAVGHRVLHGGEKITQSTLIDDYVMSCLLYTSRCV